MISLDPIRQYIYLVKPIGYAVIASVLVFGGCRWQAKLDAGGIAAAKAHADMAQLAIDTLAKQADAAEEKAKKATLDLQDAKHEADKQKADSDRRALDDARKLAAAIKRGTVRVSDTWACPAPTSADSAGQAASEATGARQADSLERIVSATAADEAAIDWVYARWESEHRAVIAAGCAVERQ